MNQHIELFCGDCLDFMRNMPDKSVDITITDPPYGKKSDRGTNGFGSAKNRRYVGNWDNTRPPKDYFDQILRVSENVIIFGANYFCDVLPISNHWLFWDKKGDIVFKNPFADGELIYTSFSKPVKRIVFKQQGFISDSKDIRYHPTQKPTELIMQLLKLYSKPHDTIFDPFMGISTRTELRISGKPFGISTNGWNSKGRARMEMGGVDKCD